MIAEWRLFPTSGQTGNGIRRHYVTFCLFCSLEEEEEEEKINYNFWVATDLLILDPAEGLGGPFRPPVLYSIPKYLLECWVTTAPFILDLVEGNTMFHNFIQNCIKKIWEGPLNFLIFLFV